MKLKNILILTILTTSTLVLESSCVQCNGNEQHMEKSSEESEQIKDFLLNFYDNYIIGHGDFSEIKYHFSPSIVSTLQSAYQEEYDGMGYAIWLFRSGAQDGPGESEVINIENNGDSWYTVYMSDMGFKGSCMFKASIEDGVVFITDFKNQWNEEQLKWDVE